MFLCLVHLLHLLYIKLFSQSETIFLMMNTQSWGGFHYSIYLKSMLIKSLAYEFKSQISMLFVTVYSKKTQSSMWILSGKHTHLLYFSWYKRFNYKYVHIMKPNVLHLNKDFFFIKQWMDYGCGLCRLGYWYTASRVVATLGTTDPSKALPERWLGRWNFHFWATFITFHIHLLLVSFFLCVLPLITFFLFPQMRFRECPNVSPITN